MDANEPQQLISDLGPSATTADGQLAPGYAGRRREGRLAQKGMGCIDAGGGVLLEPERCRLELWARRDSQRRLQLVDVQTWYIELATLTIGCRYRS